MPEITCIGCPLGCKIKVETGEKGFKTTGEGCPRGVAYAKDELTAPKRVLTAVVAVEGREILLPVKTAKAIPKEKLFEAMAEIKQIRVKPPVTIGQIVWENLAGTGVGLVAGKDVGLSQKETQTNALIITRP